MDNLITITDWFKENDWEYGFAWGDCLIRVGNKFIKLTPSNAVGGIFLKQIPYEEYVERKLKGFPVKKSKNKYWSRGLRTQIISYCGG